MLKLKEGVVKLEEDTLPKVDAPVTFNPDNAPYPVIDPPTPTLPDTLRDEPIPTKPLK